MTPQHKLELIHQRQHGYKWGEVYVPSTLAVAAEAPGGSRVSRINSRKLGRIIHCLSTPERIFTQFALLNPKLIDLHEQKMLSPVQTVHPLFGHLLMKGCFLHPITGTLDIAEEIGLKHHVILTDVDGIQVWQPFPYQGDLLLYLKSETGSLYAVNWMVKDVREAFLEKNRGQVKTPRQQYIDQEKMQLRNELEEKYYQSAGIRTVRMSRECLDPVLVSNIYMLFGLHDRCLDVDAKVLQDFSLDLNNALLSCEPFAKVAKRYSDKWGRADQFIAKIYQDIWSRELRVDLHKPVLIDRSLEREKMDIFSEYSGFFSAVPQ